jgi:hypothetical protein
MAVAILTMLAPAVSDAGEADPGRHPRRFSPARRPISVPSDFVLTRAGFMHPSCVITIHSDEVASPEGDDVVIRGPDGSERFRSGPCAYPRYRRGGDLAALAKTESGATAEAGTRAHAVPAAYDGWLCSYQGDGSFDPGSTLVTEWYVPALPTKIGDQDIALFNDIVTTAGGEGDILQPVLDFSEIPNRWAMESEHCCLGGNDIQSDLVAVSPGDLIRGTVAPSNCNASGTCANWKITTLDVTTGRSTVTNTTETSGRPYAIHPSALESYGVESCDMLPANGEATFFNNALTSPGGATYSLSYSLQVIKSREKGSGLPLDCGYAGKKSGESYTLIWQKSHYPVGGTGGAGGAEGTGGAGGGTVGDAGAGGASGSDGGLGKGGAAGTDGPFGSGGAAGAGGDAPSGGGSALGGSNAGGGGASSAGANGSGGSSPGGVSGAGASGGAGGEGGASSGTAGSLSGGGGASAGQSSGGTAGQAGVVASGGSTSDGKGGAGAHADAGPPASSSSTGCSCSLGQRGSSSGLAWLFALALLLRQIRRSRRR